MRPRNAEGRTDGGGLVGYGHSWVYGTGGSDGGFVARAAHALGLPLDNRAESGTLSTETARLITADPPPPAQTYVIMTGFNDARRYGDVPAAREAYARSLITAFTAFETVAPKARVITLEQPLIEDYSGHAPFDHASDVIIDAYNELLREVAGRHPAVDVVTVSGWQPRTMIAADGVHPNDHGHRRLAEILVDACRTERARS